MLLVIALVVGAVVGSFVALVADRLPRGENWVTGRSSCRACGQALRARELVPVISFALLRGRCAHCRAALPPDLWLGELGGMIVAVIALERGGDLAGMLALALFGWTLVLLALLDARHLWLPDTVTLPLAGLGLASAVVLPLPGWRERVLGLALGFLAFEALRRGYRLVRHREGMGGGDPKLLAAIGAWLGASALPVVVLAAALIGIGWALIEAARGRPAGGATPIPLGTMLALAALGWVAAQTTFVIAADAGTQSGRQAPTFAPGAQSGFPRPRE